MAVGDEWVGLISLFHRKNNSYRDQESEFAVHELIVHTCCNACLCL